MQPPLPAAASCLTFSGMNTPTTDPIRPTDDDARALARALCQNARFGALAVILPDGTPFVARVATGWDGTGPLMLISDLAEHTRALASDPRCALLVGEPGPRGDPLTHPRLTIRGRAEAADKATLRASWLRDHPKSALYYDFADFRLMRLVVTAAALNGGFGRAYRLTPEDFTTTLSPGRP